MSDDGSEKSLPSSGRSSPSNAGAARGASGGEVTTAERPDRTEIRGSDAGGTAVLMLHTSNGLMPLGDLQKMMGHIEPPSSKAKTEKRPFIGSPSRVHTSASTAGPSSPKRPRTDEGSESAAPAPAPASTAGPPSAPREDRPNDDLDDGSMPSVTYSTLPPSPGLPNDNDDDWRARGGPSPGATLAVPTSDAIRGIETSSPSGHSSLFDFSLNSSPRGPESPKDDA